MNAAATAGTFSDFKLIRGRKVAQLVVEIPIEQADAALRALGGLPNPAEERWVAVAVLEPAAKEEPKQIEAPKRELPLSSKVALTCQEKSFAEFALQEFPSQWARANNDPAEFVRWYCDVPSRSEIKPGTDAERLWNKLKVQYEQFQRGYR